VEAKGVESHGFRWFGWKEIVSPPPFKSTANAAMTHG
jgi:hypothetical protein